MGKDGLGTALIFFSYCDITRNVLYWGGKGERPRKVGKRGKKKKEGRKKRGGTFVLRVEDKYRFEHVTCAFLSWKGGEGRKEKRREKGRGGGEPKVEAFAILIG